MAVEVSQHAPLKRFDKAVANHLVFVGDVVDPGRVDEVTQRSRPARQRDHPGEQMVARRGVDIHGAVDLRPLLQATVSAPIADKQPLYRADGDADDRHHRHGEPRPTPDSHLQG